MVALMRDLDAAACVLARAFQEDPFLCWAEPNARRRLPMARVLFRCSLRQAERRGHLYVDPGRGSVHWFKPEAVDLSVIDLVRLRFARVVAMVSPVVIWRLLTHEGEATKRVHHFLTPGAAYLHTIGIEPALKGKGIGSEVLQAALGRIGADFERCVLRTEQETNVPFYRKNGFDLVDEAVMPTSGLRIWVFEHRNPRAAGAEAVRATG